MKRSLIAGVLALTLGYAVYAHPHISLDAKLEFEFENGQCAGFWEEWTFDVMFSAQLMSDFDVNRNGLYETAEVVRIQAEAFSNLKKYGYFTFIRKGANRVVPDLVKNFSVRMEGGNVTYRFFVPLAGKGYGDDFYVAVFDTTFYCAVRYHDDTAEITGAGEPPELVWVRELNKQFPVYYDPWGAATDGTVYTTWKKGLEIAYPEEIRIKKAKK